MINTDEIVQPAALLSEKEAYLSRASIPSLAYQRCAPWICPVAARTVVTEIGYKYNGLWLAVLVYELAGVYRAAVEYHTIRHVRSNTPLC
jgi:hypothetical protein